MHLGAIAGRVLLSLVLLTGNSHAIIVDTSCNSYETFLREAFTSAFTNADNASAALAKTPLDSHVNDVASWLFGPPFTFPRAQGRLKNVGKIPASFTTDKNDRSNSANIILYCSADHLEPTGRKDGAVFNSETGTFQVMAPGLFEACKTGVPDENGRLPVAQTYNYPGSGALTVIEFCNWYLEKVKDQRFPLIEDVANPGVLQRIVVPSSDADKGKTAMDVAKLFDSVLLHEMTHSDVVGVPQAILRIAEEYGWNACTSNKNPANSDSLALFALAVYLMRKGYIIREDGQVWTAEECAVSSSC